MDERGIIIPTGCVPKATRGFTVSSPDFRCFCNRRELQKFIFLGQGSGRLYPGLGRSRFSVVQPTIHHDGRGGSKSPRGRSRSAPGSSRLDQQALVGLSNWFDEQIPIFSTTDSDFRERNRQDGCHPLGLASGLYTSSLSVPMCNEY